MAGAGAFDASVKRQIVFKRFWMDLSSNAGQRFHGDVMVIESFGALMTSRDGHRQVGLLLEYVLKKKQGNKAYQSGNHRGHYPSTGNTSQNPPADGATTL